MNSLHEFDRYKKNYQSDIDKAVSFSGQSHDFFTRVKAEYLTDLFRNYRSYRAGMSPVAPAMEVLDIGCGHGHIHRFLLNSDIPLKLSAIDVAATVVEEARQINPSVDYLTYDGNRLPYADESFDFAYTIAVMHHVPPQQWHSFLQEMRRVVRPGGIVAIFEHNPINPLTRWIVYTCPIDENAVLLSNWRLTELISKIGLSKVESRYILFLPFDGAAYRKFDKMIGWCPLGAQYYIAARVPENS